MANDCWGNNLTTQLGVWGWSSKIYSKRNRGRDEQLEEARKKRSSRNSNQFYRINRVSVRDPRSIGFLDQRKLHSPMKTESREKERAGRERETVLRFHDRIWQRLIISNDTRVRGKRGINFGRFVVLFRTLFDYRQAFD